MVGFTSALRTSESAEWSTPADLIRGLEYEFGRFTLDPCATAETAKAPMWYGAEHDGLAQSWSGHRVFMNPPYGREIPKWVEKAWRESANALVVCLLPARTDTGWWHDFVMRGEVRFLRGRVKFSGHRFNAPFPNAIVIFRPAGRAS